MGRFVSVSRCIKCKEQLTQKEVMYSGGVCPRCGNVGSPTVVATVTRAVFVPSLWDRIRGYFHERQP